MWNCFKTKALHAFQYFYLEWMIPLELLPVIKLRELRYNARLFLEEGMETHASILAWRILWTEEPGTVQSTGSQRVRLDWSNWAGTQDYLKDSAQLSHSVVSDSLPPHESQHARPPCPSPTQWTWVWVSSGSCWWTGKPGVLLSMRSQRVRHNWLTKLKFFFFN